MPLPSDGYLCRECDLEVKQPRQETPEEAERRDERIREITRRKNQRLLEFDAVAQRVQQEIVLPIVERQISRLKSVDASACLGVRGGRIRIELSHPDSVGVDVYYQEPTGLGLSVPERSESSLVIDCGYCTDSSRNLTITATISIRMDEVDLEKTRCWFEEHFAEAVSTFLQRTSEPPLNRLI
jgi:hypothetical protein